MKAKEIPVTNAMAILPDAQFADAFALTVSGRSLDAQSAASIAFGSAPRWINWLLSVRNALVAPFGLKTGRVELSDPGQSIGIFPVLASRPDRIILGLDDRHLDFRLWVDVADLDQGCQRVTATTAVKTHNRLGRCYLRAILPFHRLIVKTMLAQVARS